MSAAAAIVVVMALVPATLAILIAVVRRPIGTLAVYAASIPVSSAIQLGLPVPDPFGSLSSLTGLAAIVALAGSLFTGRRFADRLSATVPIWLAFLGVAALTVAWSVTPSVTAFDTVVLATLVVLYVLVTLTPLQPGDRRAIEVGIVVGGMVVGVYATVLAFTGPLESAGGATRLQTGAGSGNPNILAASLLLPIAVGLGRITRETVTRGWLWAAALLPPLAAVVLTGSRGGLVSLLVVLTVIAWLSPHRGTRLRLAGASLLLIGVAALVAPGDVVDRFLGKGDTSGRTDIWRIAVLECSDHCLAGSGWGTFSDVHEQALLTRPSARGRIAGFESHNIWIGTLIEAGIAAVLLLGGALLLHARELLRVPRDARGPPLAAFVGIVFANLFLNNLEFKYFWMVLIYGAICARPYLGPVAASRRRSAPEARLEPA